MSVYLKKTVIILKYQMKNNLIFILVVFVKSLYCIQITHEYDLVNSYEWLNQIKPLD